MRAPPATKAPVTGPIKTIKESDPTSEIIPTYQNNYAYSDPINSATYISYSATYLLYLKRCEILPTYQKSYDYNDPNNSATYITYRATYLLYPKNCTIYAKTGHPKLPLTNELWCQMNESEEFIHNLQFIYINLFTIQFQFQIQFHYIYNQITINLNSNLYTFIYNIIQLINYLHRTLQNYIHPTKKKNK